MEKAGAGVKELTVPTRDEEKAARLAQALRDNLRRRKEQAREADPPTPTLPPVATDPS
jgi:hypothetical protein